MKKLFFVMTIVALTATVAQAQKYYAGGIMGFDIDGSSSSGNKGPTNFSLEMQPKVGYYWTPKISFGLSFTLGMDISSSRSGSETLQNLAFNWGFAPFGRYTLLEVGRFTVYGEGSIGVFGSLSSSKYGSSTNKGPSTFGFGLDAMPVLSFRLTDKVDLETTSNIARFGFSTQTQTSGGNKHSTTHFGFGVDSEDFFSTPFKIGLIYKF